MSEFFLSVDPSGVYLDFVKKSLSSEKMEKKILWVWGSNTGKTTLNHAIQEAYPTEVFVTSGQILLGKHEVPKSTKLVFYFNDIHEPKIPAVPTIVESDNPPPSFLDCIPLELKRSFQPDRRYKIDTRAIGDLLSH